MSNKKDPNWMQNLWRPAMGWMYMFICLLDMAVFPILWSLLQAYHSQQITQWNPLTLQGAGLFHIAMGAVLGIAAFGRTQEKLSGTAANPNAVQNIGPTNNNMPMSNYGGGYNGNNTGFNTNTGFNNNGFNSPSGFGPGVSGGVPGTMSTQAFNQGPVAKRNNKFGPPEPDYPEI